MDLTYPEQLGEHERYVLQILYLTHFIINDKSVIKNGTFHLTECVNIVFVRIDEKNLRYFQSGNKTLKSQHTVNVFEATSKCVS